MGSIPPRLLVRLAIMAALSFASVPASAQVAIEGGAKKSAPIRIVSLNLCADQLVVSLVPPERIAALSKLSRDRGLSWVAERADTLPQVQPHAEDVLALRPDIVLAGRYTAKPAVDFIKSRGVPVFYLSLLSDFDAIREQTRAVGAVLGASERAEALLTAMDTALATDPPPKDKRPRPVALSWQPGGFTAGSGSLMDAVFNAAGFDNLATLRGLKGYGYLTLETVVAGAPDLLIAEDTLPGRPSLREALLAHTALRRGAGAIGRRYALPAPLTACAGPFTAEAVMRLRRVRQEIEAERQPS